MRDDLVAIEIEVDPVLRRSPFAAAEQHRRKIRAPPQGHAPERPSERGAVRSFFGRHCKRERFTQTDAARHFLFLAGFFFQLGLQFFG
jgi:hypothetical protein